MSHEVNRVAAPRPPPTYRELGLALLELLSSFKALESAVADAAPDEAILIRHVEAQEASVDLLARWRNCSRDMMKTQLNFKE